MSADLLYSETERDLAAALSDLLADRAAPADVIARTERTEAYDLKLWRTVAAEIGVAGLLIPEALGGAGASYRELAAAAEQFGAFAAPIPYLGSAAVATAALLSAARAAAVAADDGGPGAMAPDDQGGFGSASSGPAAAVRAAQLRAAAQAPASAGSAEHAPVSPAAGLLRRLADGSLTAALVVTTATRSGAPFPGIARITGRGDSGPASVKLTGRIPAVIDALTADVLLVPADGVPSGLRADDVLGHSWRHRSQPGRRSRPGRRCRR